MGGDRSEQRAWVRLALACGALVHRLRFVLPVAWLVVIAAAVPFAGRASVALTSSNPALSWAWGSRRRCWWTRS